MSWRLYFGCQLAFHSTVALDLQTRYRYGFYDSLVIAAALDAGCTRLYSEDLQDGQRIEGLTVENPFREL
jgi:predicted nucleic acid-binding protein